MDSADAREALHARMAGWNQSHRRGVEGDESNRWKALGRIGKSEMNSIALNHEPGAIRLTSSETATYTEVALGA